jgi:hypothetical protein
LDADSERRTGPNTRVVEDDVPLAERMGGWESDERDQMNQEYERPSGPNHVVVGGGDVQRLREQVEHARRNQLECGRPSGSSHIVVGGGDAQRMESLLENLVEMEDDQGSGELEGSWSSKGADCQ